MPRKRNFTRLVTHFWVSQWMMSQVKPWTRKQLAMSFDVSFPTAKDWTIAGVESGLIEEVQRRGNSVFFVSRRAT